MADGYTGILGGRQIRGNFHTAFYREPITSPPKCLAVYENLCPGRDGADVQLGGRRLRVFCHGGRQADRRKQPKRAQDNCHHRAHRSDLS